MILQFTTQKINNSVPLLANKYGAQYQQIVSYDNYIDETLEVILMGDYHENIRHVAAKMSFPYTFGIRSSFYKSQNQGGTYYLEIRKLGSSKGDGLRKLLKHLNIRMKETAVFGDWYNDKTLFDTDALKIAVANAVPELKKMADIVTQKTIMKKVLQNF